jgi:hypothetical protein
MYTNKSFSDEAEDVLRNMDTALVSDLTVRVVPDEDDDEEGSIVFAELDN